MLRIMAGMCRLMLLAGFAAMALQGRIAVAQTSQPVTLQNCQKPEQALIKPTDDEAIKRYNDQARAFNGCMKKLIDSSGAEIDRMRQEGNAAIKSLAETANRQSQDIADKMEAAIGGHAPPPESQAGLAGWQYPDADCVMPDKAQPTPRYQAAQLDYRACVQAYVKQAAAEMHQIEASTEARIQQISQERDARINRLQDAVNGAIASANHAASDAIQTLHTLEPANTFNNGRENVIVEGAPPPQLGDTPKGDGDPRAIVCRKPQQLPDSRLLGPEICKRNKVWASLYQAGKDISADGQTILPSEKARSIKRATLACIRMPVPNGPEPYSGYFINEICN